VRIGNILTRKKVRIAKCLNWCDGYKWNLTRNYINRTVAHEKNKEKEMEVAQSTVSESKVTEEKPASQESQETIDRDEMGSSTFVTMREGKKCFISRSASHSGHHCICFSSRLTITRKHAQLP